MKRNNPMRNLLAVAVASALLGLAACETTAQTSAGLEQARSAVSQAGADPNVSKYAPTELDRARKLLVDAESYTREKGANDQTAEHYAYLSTQMAHIAEQRASEQVAVARIKSGESDRQQILLATNAARSEAQSARLENLQAAQTPRGIVLTLDDVLFDTGKAALKPGAQRSIEQIAAFLQENPERRVQVEGFTDNQGANDYNLELSQSRADSVAMAIIHRGIDAERVRALGYGKEFPVASNSNDGSRQLNRRVEVIVSNSDAAIPGRAASTP